MRFLDNLRPPTPQLNEARENGTASDFTRNQHTYLGYKLQDVDDPILREHMANWLADILKMRHADSFVKKVMKRDHYSVEPGFRSRQFSFFAWALRDIRDPYRWKFTYDWVVKAMDDGSGRDINGNRVFRLEYFRDKGTPRDFEDMHKD